MSRGGNLESSEKQKMLLSNAGIISSSLVCRRKAEEATDSWATNVGIGAKSLGRDLGDLHTCSHSHYSVRQSNGVGGWGKVRLRYKPCR